MGSFIRVASRTEAKTSQQSSPSHQSKSEYFSFPSFYLLIYGLATPEALSLKCYVCVSSTTNEECNKNTQECQAPVDMCMTVVDTLGDSSHSGMHGGFKWSEWWWNPQPHISWWVFFFCLCPGSAKSIVKQCASQDTCNSASSSVDANGDGNTINCCNTHDLCNFSAAESIHVRTSLLLSSAGALLLLSHWSGRHPHAVGMCD